MNERRTSPGGVSGGLHDQTSDFDIEHERANNKFLREATDNYLAGNAQEWIRAMDQSVTRRLVGNQNLVEQDLTVAKEVVSGLPLHHTTSLEAFQEAVKCGRLDCYATLSEAQKDLLGNTYDFDIEHGLDHFVYLRLGGRRFRFSGRKQSVSLEFNKSLLDRNGTYVSIQDFCFATEAKKYGPPLIDPWKMYLKENFKGKDYPEVLAHIIAAGYTDPQDFLEDPIPNIRLPGIESVHFVTSRQIQSEVKVYNHLDLSELERVVTSSSQPNVRQALIELGLPPDKIVAV